jgi:hypothetical protein
VSYGRGNPYPFEYGGGLSETEQTYQALRSAMGKGRGVPPPEGGILDDWLWSKAEAIGPIDGLAESAIAQYFPHAASVTLPVWERLLGLDQGEDEQTRRDNATSEYTRKLAADWPTLLEELEAIDPAFSLETVDNQKSIDSYFGKTLAPRGGVPSYGLQPGSQWPGYSDHFVLHVLYTLGGGQSVIPPLEQARAERLLNEVLPAWGDFAIYTGGAVFEMDGGLDGTSLMDSTALTDS